MKERLTNDEVARARCAKGHAGATTLTRIRGGKLAECDGCAAHYTAAQVKAARPGVHGEGGVVLYGERG